MQSQDPISQTRTGKGPGRSGDRTEVQRPSLYDPRAIDYVLGSVSPEGLRALGEGFPQQLRELQAKVRVVSNRCADTERLLIQGKRIEAVQMLIHAQGISPAAEAALAAIESKLNGKRDDSTALGELPRFLGALRRDAAAPGDNRHPLARDVAAYRREEPLRQKLDELLPEIRIQGSDRKGGTVGIVEAVHPVEGALDVRVGKSLIRLYADQSVTIDVAGAQREVIPAEHCYQKPKIQSEVVVFGSSRRRGGQDVGPLGWMPMRVALDQVSKLPDRKANVDIASKEAGKAGSPQKPLGASKVDATIGAREPGNAAPPEKPLGGAESEGEFNWDPAL